MRRCCRRLWTPSPSMLLESPVMSPRCRADTTRSRSGAAWASARASCAQSAAMRRLQERRREREREGDRRRKREGENFSLVLVLGKSIQVGGAVRSCSKSRSMRGQANNDPRSQRCNRTYPSPSPLPAACYCPGQCERPENETSLAGF